MNKKGFTLIELLVVIAIIGVLASIVLSSLSDARSRARDAKRLTDIRTIQTALEIYYLDNGRYPWVTGSTQRSHLTSWEGLEAEMGVTLPRDPLNLNGPAGGAPNSTGNYSYHYFANPTAPYCARQQYGLYYNLEGSENTEPNGYAGTWCDGTNNIGGTYPSAGVYIVTGFEQ